MGISGFVITPIKTCIPLACLVTFVVQFDLKGWIPPAVMNSITSGQPMVLYHIAQQLKGVTGLTQSSDSIGSESNSSLSESSSTNPPIEVSETEE